jgi:outer membrane protein TolC
MKERVALSLTLWLFCAVAPARAREATALTLTQAITIALEQSPLLRAARYEVEAAQAGVEQARAGFLPRLNLQESFTRADNPVFAFSSKLNQGRFTQSDFEVRRLNDPGEMNNFRTSFSFEQPLYTAGKAALGFTRAQLSREATIRGLERTQQEVIFQVAKAYYGVLLAQADLAVVQAALQAAEANRNLARDRFETGLVVESDVLSAEVRLASLTEQQISTRNQVTLAKAAVNDVIGRPLEEPFAVEDHLSRLPGRDSQLEELETLTLQKRPDYQKLGLEEQALERGIALAQAEFFPTVSATANYEVNRFNFAANGQASWFVGIVAQWNLFNGLADRAKVAESRANLARVQALRARMASTIMLEVKEAFLQLKSAEERIGVANRAVTQAMESFKIVTDRYQAGLTTMVDLLASEAALTQAKGNLSRALYDYNVSLTSLELAVGTISKDSF